LSKPLMRPLLTDIPSPGRRCTPSPMPEPRMV
jgi:hypothetical protein